MRPGTFDLLILVFILGQAWWIIPIIYKIRESIRVNG